MNEVKSSLPKPGRLVRWSFALSILMFIMLGALVTGQCPPPPAPPAGASAKIVLEDMHSGAWMAIDNATFEWYDSSHPTTPLPQPVQSCTGNQWGTCQQLQFDPYNQYRHGVMFQMGETRTVAGGFQPHTHAGNPTPGSDKVFAGIYIKHRDQTNQVVETFLWVGSRKIAGTDFDWLDIRGVDPLTRNLCESDVNQCQPLPCVIDPLTAYSMFINDTSVWTECDCWFEDLVNGTAPVPPACSPRNIATADAYYPNGKTWIQTDPAYHCVRNRSIHASVEAHYLITYWADAEYEAVTGPTTEITASGFPATHGTPHVSYTFQLPNEMIVDRWYQGCHQETYKGVTEVRILHHVGTSYHLGYPHTPVNGGGKG